MTIRLRNTLSAPESLTREYLARVFLVSPNGAPTLISSGAVLPTITPIVEATGVVAGSDLQYTTTAIPETDEINPAGSYYVITETYGNDLVGFYTTIPLSGYADNTIVVVPTVLSSAPGQLGGQIREAPILQSTGVSTPPSLTTPVLPGGFTPYIGNLVLNYNTDDPVQAALYMCKDLAPSVTWVKLWDNFGQPANTGTLPWEMPWGYINHAQLSANGAAIGAGPGDVISVTFTAVANRRYKVSYKGQGQESDTTTGHFFDVTYADNTVIDRIVLFTASGYIDWNGGFIIFTPAAGSTTIKVRGSRFIGVGNFTPIAAATVLTVFMVEDIGPNGSPV